MDIFWQQLSLIYKLKDFDNSSNPPRLPKSMEATLFHDKIISMVDKYVLQLIETKKPLISAVQSGFPEVAEL